MGILIKSIHITEFSERTWGRVYLQYDLNSEPCFIFKNWLKFDEKTYKGVGDLNEIESYNWFPENKRHVFSDYTQVLNGKADHLTLTTPEFKEKYGTPSKILKKLLIELAANVGEPIENRKGWFARYQKPEIILSPIVLSKDLKVTLPLYNEIELKFKPNLKLLYILFLRHPEGLLLKEIYKYKEELTSIYSKISKSPKEASVNKVINSLIDLRGNTINETISKIKKILIDELGETISESYQIQGVSGEPYKLGIDYDLITIEL
ncbi:MAG: hypothetical protein KA163_07110 [Bacteroidia bacterium]|nr:hypothetical protein [Bacteroidia bacterium]